MARIITRFATIVALLLTVMAEKPPPIQGNAWPIIGYYAARRTTSALVPVLFFSVIVATLALHFSTGLTITTTNAYSQALHVAPINAQEILGKCRSLRSPPPPPTGPSAEFKKRESSDRYEPGTNATWIRNCRILTGERNGSVIIDGDLFLDKGVVRAVGKVPWHLPDKTPNVTVIDAGGAWVTPGLGERMHIC
jgi:hypothetical protein